MKLQNDTKTTVKGWQWDAELGHSSDFGWAMLFSCPCSAWLGRMLAWQRRGFCCCFCLFVCSIVVCFVCYGWLFIVVVVLTFFPQNHWALFYNVSVPASSSAFLEFTESMAACIRICRHQRLILYSGWIPLARKWMNVASTNGYGGYLVKTVLCHDRRQYINQAFPERILPQATIQSPK